MVLRNWQSKKHERKVPWDGSQNPLNQSASPVHPSLCSFSELGWSMHCWVPPSVALFDLSTVSVSVFLSIYTSLVSSRQRTETAPYVGRQEAEWHKMVSLFRRPLSVNKSVIPPSPLLDKINEVDSDKVQIIDFFEIDNRKTTSAKVKLYDEAGIIGQIQMVIKRMFDWLNPFYVQWGYNFIVYQHCIIII